MRRKQKPKVEIVYQEVQLVTGEPHNYAILPSNFLVVVHVECQDGTKYAAGYNKNHHPNGVPVDRLTLRRISIKTGEMRAIQRGHRK